MPLILSISIEPDLFQLRRELRIDREMEEAACFLSSFLAMGLPDRQVALYDLQKRNPKLLSLVNFIAYRDRFLN